MPTREELAALIARGLKNREIGAMFEVTRGTVYRWKKAHGLERPCLRDYKRRDLPIGEIRQMVYDGRTRKDMADKFGCSVDVLDRIMAENGIRTRRSIARYEGAQGRRHAGIDVLPSRSALEWANPFGICRCSRWRNGYEG